MRWTMLLVCIFSVMLQAAPPATSPTVKSVIAEYDARMKEFEKAYQAANTQAQREKLFQENYPNTDDFAPRLLKLATTQPTSPDARDAAKWVIRKTQNSTYCDSAVDVLMN